MLQQYHALTRGAGLVDLPGRTLLEIAGEDRAALLHNLSTADVRRLKPGQGCETLLTNVQAKVLAYVTLFAESDLIVLETAAGQQTALIEHLDRYIIREDVQLHDRSGDGAEMLLSGQQTEELVRRLGAELPADELFAHCQTQVASIPATVRRVDWTAPRALLIQTAAEQQGALREALVGAGATVCAAEAVEAARIEQGTPLFGMDVTSANLPQEIARDERLISFTKGCYIGQETVARIDALGHVNRTLCGVAFQSSDIPPAGSELRSPDDDKVVGSVTSAAHSPRLARPLALAYIRRGYNIPGTRLASSSGSAEVVALPLDRGFAELERNSK